MKSKSNDIRIDFLISALISLIFFSKISLKSIFIIPREFSYIIFQYGMHPYLNIFFTFFFGGPLIYFWARNKVRYHLSLSYQFFILSLILILFTQTVLQIFYVNLVESGIMQFGAMAFSIALVFIYGLIVPSLWSQEKIFEKLQKWTSQLTLFSLLLYPFLGSALFKGGRFIGVFKHIPHMVTCSTVSSILTFIYLFNEKYFWRKIYLGFVVACSVLVVFLTGTRSSLAAVIIAMGLTLLSYKFGTNLGKLFKFLILIFVTTYFVLFGHQTFQYAHAIATGEVAIAGRQAQDGLGSRWDEVLRGYEIFIEQPLLGRGLISKFSAGHDVDVSHYNAMKDPHNIFISAGVVGGWPLLGITFLALAMCFYAALKLLCYSEFCQKWVGIYLITHLPILIIYHVHLSIGGMADRIYWIMFGLLALKVTKMETP